MTTHSKDARRALTRLGASPKNVSNSLIHRGLLDKASLVQNAARMVIEDILGIRLKNGDEGLLRAQELIRAWLFQTSLIQKGVP